MSSLLYDNGISLIVVAPEDFSESKPISREHEIERLEAHTYICSADIRVYLGSIATTSLNKRNVAP